MPLRDEVEYSAIDEDQEERSSYYGGASIPFVWESRPGTPKHNHFSNRSFLPPLTPPPSYYSSSGILSTPKRQNKVRTKLSRILSMSLFHDLRKSSNSSKKTTNCVSGSSFSWSSTSSSSSLSSSPPHSLRKPVSLSKKSTVLYASYKEHELRSSPTSTLCYSNGGIKGFSSSMGSMKRALFSVPRQGSTGKALIIGDMNKA
ncbi:hypothetical protein EUTSA_v10006243mg [Eutrema salsugineum]|uniref:Uncharacterized protein n=1 Tax=Eutrema salsugineum TaxID=72664 RepID=V4LPN2_EUTSA|nr:uncharacterized protein LOC18020176 [Eutrema salsugineum]ESQ44457.1 hypothetical protein EUTSA_v10006243mg [Eutrema salsugineum]